MKILKLYFLLPIIYTVAFTAILVNSILHKPNDIEEAFFLLYYINIPTSILFHGIVYLIVYIIFKGSINAAFETMVLFFAGIIQYSLLGLLLHGSLFKKEIDFSLRKY